MIFNSLLDSTKIGSTLDDTVFQSIKAYHDWLTNMVKTNSGYYLSLNQGKMIQILDVYANNDFICFHLINAINNEIIKLNNVVASPIHNTSLMVARIQFCLREFSFYLSPSTNPVHNIFLIALDNLYLKTSNFLMRQSEPLHAEQPLSPMSSSDSVATLPHCPDSESPSVVEPTKRRGWEAYAHLHEQRPQTTFFASANASRAPSNNQDMLPLSPRVTSSAYQLRDAPASESAFTRNIVTDTFPKAEKIQLLMSLYVKDAPYISTLLEQIFNGLPCSAESCVPDLILQRGC